MDENELLKQLVELTQNQQLDSLDSKTKETLLKMYTFKPKTEQKLLEGLDKETLDRLKHYLPNLQRSQDRVKTSKLYSKLSNIEQQLQENPADTTAFNKLVRILKQNWKIQGIAGKTVNIVADNPQLWSGLNTEDKQTYYNLLTESLTNSRVDPATLGFMFWLLANLPVMEEKERNKTAHLADSYYLKLQGVYSDYETICALLQNQTPKYSRSWTKRKQQLNNAHNTVDGPAVQAISGTNYISIAEIILGVLLVEKTSVSWEDITVALNLTCETTWTTPQIKTALEGAKFEQINQPISTFEELKDLLTTGKNLAAAGWSSRIDRHLTGNIYILTPDQLQVAITHCFYAPEALLQSAVENFTAENYEQFIQIVVDIEQAEAFDENLYIYWEWAHNNRELSEQLLNNYKTLPYDQAFRYLFVGAVQNRLETQPNKTMPLHMLITAAEHFKTLRIVTGELPHIQKLEKSLNKKIEEAFNKLIKNRTAAQLSGQSAVLNASEYSDTLTADQLADLAEKIVYTTNNTAAQTTKITKLEQVNRKTRVNGQKNKNGKRAEQ